MQNFTPEDFTPSPQVISTILHLAHHLRIDRGGKINSLCLS